MAWEIVLFVQGGDKEEVLGPGQWAWGSKDLNYWVRIPRTCSPVELWRGWEREEGRTWVVFGYMKPHDKFFFWCQRVVWGIWSWICKAGHCSDVFLSLDLQFSVLYYIFCSSYLSIFFPAFGHCMGSRLYHSASLRACLEALLRLKHPCVPQFGVRGLWLLHLRALPLTSCVVVGKLIVQDKNHNIHL